MNPVIYTNGRIVTPNGIVDDSCVVTLGEVISDVVPTPELDPKKSEIVDLQGKLLLPGFVDVQVNGGGGVLFNDAPSVEGIRSIASAHWQFGTTGLLPTLISDDLQVVEAGLTAIDQAIQQAVPGVLGIHIEGPFLAPDRRGIHDASKMKSLTVDLLQALTPLKHGVTVLTLAPEQTESRLIRQLVRKGFIVCAGHSNASYEQSSEAIAHGLSGFTHLFNAMSPLRSRDPGMVGAALTQDRTWCGIIADHHHVSGAAINIAYRCKGPEKLMLVTDAMPPVGTDMASFKLGQKTIQIRDGACMDTEGTLAGAALDMASAFRNIISMTGCSVTEASLMSSTTAAKFLALGHKTGTIAPGLQASFVILDKDHQVISTIIDGKYVFNRSND